MMLFPLLGERVRVRANQRTNGHTSNRPTPAPRLVRPTSPRPQSERNKRPRCVKMEIPTHARSIQPSRQDAAEWTKNEHGTFQRFLDESSRSVLLAVYIGVLPSKRSKDISGLTHGFLEYRQASFSKDSLDP